LATAIIAKGGEISEDIKEHFLDSTFATLTNVNFDPNRFHDYLREANQQRNALKRQAQTLGVDVASITGPAQFQYKVNKSPSIKS
jgi:hydroxylamine reductase